MNIKRFTRNDKLSMPIITVNGGGYNKATLVENTLYVCSDEKMFFLKVGLYSLFPIYVIKNNVFKKIRN